MHKTYWTAAEKELDLETYLTVALMDVSSAAQEVKAGSWLTRSNVLVDDDKTSWASWTKSRLTR